MPLGDNIKFRNDSISDEGSLFWWGRVVNADGSSISGETWTLMPARSKNNTQNKQPLERVMGEDKKPFASKLGNKENAPKITLLQNDVKTEKFLTKGVIGKHFALLIPVGVSEKDDSGKEIVKVRYYPIAQISSSYNEERPGTAQPECEIMPLPVTTQKTLLGSDLPTGTDSMVSKLQLAAVTGATAYFTIAVGEDFDVAGFVKA